MRAAKRRRTRVARGLGRELEEEQAPLAVPAHRGSHSAGALAQRLRAGTAQRLDQLEPRRHVLLQQREEEVFLAGEVVVEHALGDGIANV
jgi:hypothetical protein